MPLPPAQRPDIDSILKQSLPKPGLAETLLYWCLSRPLSEIPAPRADVERPATSS